MADRDRSMVLPDWYHQLAGYFYSRRVHPNPFNPNVFSETIWQGKQDRGTAPLSQKFTSDESHPAWRMKDKPSASSGDHGGDFHSHSSGVTISDGSQKRAFGWMLVSSKWNLDDFSGPFLATNPAGVPFPTVVLGDLNTLGATAVARCKPTNNVADVGTSIGELFREGLPKLFGASLWKDRTNLARSAPSEFLNSEFGWKPVVSDIRDVAYAAANSDRILSQYERNAGRVVRRRYEFPGEFSLSEGLVTPSTNGFVFSPTWQNSLTDASINKPNLRYKATVSRRQWFSGAFTYHLPRGYKSRNGMVSAAAKAGPLLGIELTPNVVWNLAPWSWAIDWFSNAGDVVSNLSDWATDGLVMKYGYIMEHVRHDVTYYLDGPSQFKFESTGRIPATVTAWTEFKRRTAASPFGFGITYDGLSPRQLAISAALGLTRVFR